MRKYKKILASYLLWRILLFLPLAVGFALLPYRAGYEYTRILQNTSSGLLHSLWLYPWANFDGVHYLSISANGYITEGAFFPLFPLIIRYLSYLMGSGPAFTSVYFFSGLVLANLFFFLSLVGFYNLIRLDFSKKIASGAILVLLIFPTSFFFASIYSESLFLFLALSTFYLARKRRWLAASFTALLLASTRLVGILILPALVYEFIVSERPTINLNLSKITKAIPFLFVPLGLAAYSWFNLKKWGDALYFIKAHAELANSREVSKIVLFPQTIFRYFKILFALPISQYEWWIALLELAMFLFVSVLLYFAWKKKVRLSYLIFSFLAFLLPVSSGTFTGLPRYVLMLFPIYLVLATIKNQTAKKAYLVLSAGLLFVLLLFFARGYFVA